MIADLPMNFYSVTPLMLVANVSSDKKAQDEQILGICRTVQNKTLINPINDAAEYMRTFNKVDGFIVGALTTKIIQAPKNGLLQLRSINQEFYEYEPHSISNNQESDDFFVIQVEKKGVKITIHYYLNLINSNESFVEYCERPLWKISRTNSGHGLQNVVSLMPDMINTSLRKTVSIAVEYFSTGLISQTTINTVTLDTNAEIYGWHINDTPYFKNKFLPTSAE